MSSPISNENNPDPKLLPFQMDHLPEFFRRKSERELNETPGNKREKMPELKTLIAGNQATSGLHFEEDLLVQYLRHSKYDVQRAFKHIQNYVALRGKHNHLFKPIPDDYFLSKNSVNFILPLPERTSDGCTVVLCRFGEWDHHEMAFDDLVRLSIMTFSQMMRDPMTQINGFKVIHDFKDTTWSHYRYSSPWNLHFLLYATIDCIPARYKEIHFINESVVLKIMWNIVKRFLSAKIRSRVIFHRKVEELLDYFPRSVLPVDYGGDLQADGMKEWTRKANKDHEANTMNGHPNFY